MKTILVDAVKCFVSEQGEIFKEMQELLETYPNKKLILTSAPDESMEKYGLNRVPYEVFTLRHDPEKTDPKYFQIMLGKYNLKPEDLVYFEHGEQAVKTAQSIGINTYFYDNDKKDLVALKEFLDKNL